jgi:DNA adenine methylase
MKYMGSKARIARFIIPIMTKERSGRPWVEPFVGGGNIIDKVDGYRFGYDSNPYVIQALETIRDRVAYIPKSQQEFNENDYSKLRENDTHWLKGYASFAYSYGGKFLGGWRRDSQGNRDYVKESYRSALMQSVGLQGVLLRCQPYQELQFEGNSLIYCDPPYAKATRYQQNFDHAVFWDWCRKRTKEGHIVFISEYQAPEDFECIWEREMVSSLTKNTGSKRAKEKLFRYKGA